MTLPKSATPFGQETHRSPPVPCAFPTDLSPFLHPTMNSSLNQYGSSSSSGATTSSGSPRGRSAAAKVIDLAMAETVKRHPILRALGIGAMAIALACLLLVLMRFVAVLLLHGHFSEPLGQVCDRLELPEVARRNVWWATLILSGAGLLPLCRKALNFLWPLVWSRPRLRDYAFTGALFAIPWAPVVAKKLHPVREIDPVTASWFDEDTIDPATGEPKGLIGCIREGDGTWRFYNVALGRRQSDAVPRSRVTPALRREWETWRRAHEEKAAVEKAQREAAERLQRLQDEQNRRDFEEKAAQAAADRKQAEDKAERERLQAEAERQTTLAHAEAERHSAETALEQARRDRAARETELLAAQAEAARAQQQQRETAARAAQERETATATREKEAAALRAGETRSPEATQPATLPFRFRDVPLRRMSASEGSYPGARCNHCGLPPTSHFWYHSRYQCPFPCSHCQQPLLAHRHIEILEAGVWREYLKCPGWQPPDHATARP